jgi:hypothetical protein
VSEVDQSSTRLVLWSSSSSSSCSCFVICSSSSSSTSPTHAVRSSQCSSHHHPFQPLHQPLPSPNPRTFRLPTTTNVVFSTNCLNTPTSHLIASCSANTPSSASLLSTWLAREVWVSCSWAWRWMPTSTARSLAGRVVFGDNAFEREHLQCS